MKGGDRLGAAKDVLEKVRGFPFCFNLSFFVLVQRSSSTASLRLCLRCLSCLDSTASICPRRLLFAPFAPPPSAPSAAPSQGNASQGLRGTEPPPDPGALLGSAAPPPRALSAAFLQKIFLTATRAGETKEEGEREAGAEGERSPSATRGREPEERGGGEAAPASEAEESAKSSASRCVAPAKSTRGESSEPLMSTQSMASSGTWASFPGGGAGGSEGGEEGGDPAPPRPPTIFFATSYM